MYESLVVKQHSFIDCFAAILSIMVKLHDNQGGTHKIVRATACNLPTCVLTDCRVLLNSSVCVKLDKRY